MLQPGVDVDVLGGLKYARIDLLYSWLANDSALSQFHRALALGVVIGNIGAASLAKFSE
jgi:hypothetical protein